MTALPQRPDPIAHLTGALSGLPFPGGISLPGGGGKFDTSGAVLRWPGNTFVCNVDPGSESFQRLVGLQEQVKRSPFGALFTFLPAPSFHMTVFQGYSPRELYTEHWPEGLSAESSRDATTDFIAARIDGANLPRFSARPTGLYAGNSVTMAGLSPEDDARMRAARRHLRDLTGIHPPGFETYVFHITLGYLIQWLTSQTARDLVAFSDEIGTTFCEETPQIDLQDCAFCTFETMHHFEPVSILRTE